MASKKALLGGAQVKVENMSGFDKSRFNAFTAPLGSIVPMCKQLVLPGRGKLSISLSAQLPPLATDAFLRSHLKVEAFLVPMRQLYGGFQSWFSGEAISPNTGGSASLGRAKLPRLAVYGTTREATPQVFSQSRLNTFFGPHSLMDYLGVKFAIDGVGGSSGRSAGDVIAPDWVEGVASRNYSYFNIFPFLAYQWCIHHFYRNKLIERPLFAPPDFSNAAVTLTDYPSVLPWVSFSAIKDFKLQLSASTDNTVSLLNRTLLTLAQRNYGFDYFSTALPSAESGTSITVDTSGGNFTISALRAANTTARFAELNQLCNADYVESCRARYGKAPSTMVSQRPILLGSADFPMFTSGVEQSAQGAGSGSTGNPFAGIAARYGRAHAEGSDFVCEFDCDEPSYLMVMCSLVPEANYARGVDHDMKLFTQDGSLVDLPCHMLEQVGYEPIYASELWKDDSGASNPLVFGYQPRYMHHKAGSVNEVHGLFRKGASLQSFIPQRDFPDVLSQVTIGSNFLKVNSTDLDNVTAVGGALSGYGVMIDSRINLFISEPLGESTLPSLADPAYEHGRSVYVKRGGVSVND